jgi:hypothetical protein
MNLSPSSHKYWQAMDAGADGMACHVTYEMYYDFAMGLGSGSTDWQMDGVDGWKPMSRDEWQVRLAQQKMKFQVDKDHVERYPGAPNNCMTI